MRQEFKLIYIGILKFGFKNSGKVSIIGLIDFIAKNHLVFDEEPITYVNKTYVPKSEDWFWEIEMWNRNNIGHRCLVIYFDNGGCHYCRYFGTETDWPQKNEEGMIEQYDGFLGQYRWLMTNEKNEQ